MVIKSKQSRNRGTMTSVWEREKISTNRHAMLILERGETTLVRVMDH